MKRTELTGSPKVAIPRISVPTQIRGKVLISCMILLSPGPSRKPNIWVMLVIYLVRRKLPLSTLMFLLSKLTKVLDYSQYSSPKKIRCVWARVLSILSNKSFRRGNISKISLGCLQDASQFIVRDIQLCFLSCPSLVVASTSV